LARFRIAARTSDPPVGVGRVENKRHIVVDTTMRTDPS
jgi:hypothetical protein